MASLQFLLILSVIGLSAALPALQYPIHASCNIQWTFATTSCDKVNEALYAAANKMQGTTGCDDGSEKCLYTVESHSASKMTLKHETPKKHYKDDLTITFSASGSGCSVKAASTSETWYAYLDDGTNYCNLENLLTVGGLKTSDVTEQTSDSQCTQYSSRDCSKY
ncbi:uncharacterized protein LOC135808294 [Sycon ciliatum]|uniref:uncharacterized protein LOC135808290 n=1 Tax=Sycon ciliatum TaxID=27933 RepID=UPI0031F61CFA